MAYPEFLRLLYPDDLAILLQRRLQKIIGPNFSPDSLAPALLVVKSLKPHVAVQVLKTWSNAWATSHRFHESRRLPCLFGCHNKPESLNHYAFCPYIKSTVEQHNSVCNELSAECLLGLSDPSIIRLKRVAAMFYAYHAVSLHPMARSLQSIDQGTEIPCTHLQQFQQIFAGSFEAALKHAC